MAKPSILLIPGASGLPEFYDSVMDPVTAKGYTIRGLHMRSVGLKAGIAREGVPPSMYDDAALIAKEVEKLADEGKDVILIAHSYGGVPTTESTKGLSKEERREQGKSGGIVRLAYMTSLVPAVGIAAMSVLGDAPQDQKMDFRIDEQGWMHHNDVSKAAAICFQDIPKEEGEMWIRKFPPHSSVSFTNKLTHAGYKTIPVSYLLCEEDLCIPAQTQKAEIELIEKESGKNVDVTYLKAGHVPIVSKPQEVVNWILDVAGKH
ncbi:alpha/beta-hydrolase [Mytilinidion resinicola]|uniref:Alpha/beta-hydrolase n=1 Tax=Mytilinidion resinicola TaxID=574789 RepID=A0A6A6Z6J6_9PEZI|nr:alpha/beta-hydrolase [Mytilinidion resinicola]KAF2816721.1 alpha/beta-hydrolase [Mytilinidion resinicola]